MRMPEKKDLFLRELYGLKHENKYYDIRTLIRSAHLTFNSLLSLQRMINQLKIKELIEVYDSEGLLKARLSRKGIAFCEFTSYAYPNHPIVVKEERATFKRLQ